jgi:hypothetical protein
MLLLDSRLKKYTNIPEVVGKSKRLFLKCIEDNTDGKTKRAACTYTCFALTSEK